MAIAGWCFAAAAAAVCCGLLLLPPSPPPPPSVRPAGWRTGWRTPWVSIVINTLAVCAIMCVKDFETILEANMITYSIKLVLEFAAYQPPDASPKTLCRPRLNAVLTEFDTTVALSRTTTHAMLVFFGRLCDGSNGSQFDQT